MTSPIHRNIVIVIPAHEGRRPEAVHRWSGKRRFTAVRIRRGEARVRTAVTTDGRLEGQTRPLRGPAMSAEPGSSKSPRRVLLKRPTSDYPTGVTSAPATPSACRGTETRRMVERERNPSKPLHDSGDRAAGAMDAAMQVEISIDRNRHRDYFAPQQLEYRRHGREIRDRTLGAHRHDGLTAVENRWCAKDRPGRAFFIGKIGSRPRLA